MAAIKARARLGSKGRETIWRPRGVMPPLASKASSTHNCLRAPSNASVCSTEQLVVFSSTGIVYQCLATQSTLHILSSMLFVQSIVRAAVFSKISCSALLAASDHHVIDMYILSGLQGQVCKKLSTTANQKFEQAQVLTACTITLPSNAAVSCSGAVHAHRDCHQVAECMLTVGASRKSNASTSTGRGKLFRDSTVVSKDVRWISGTATLGISCWKCLLVYSR